MDELLSLPAEELFAKFSNFENPSVWLRYGLSLYLNSDDKNSALQAFLECLRVDQKNPLPAMMASKIQIEQKNLEEALKWAQVAIERSQNIDKPLLKARCHLLASIIHAHIYEREPKSIRRMKLDNLKTSKTHLESALDIYQNDHLIYFHKALHDAKERLFPSAIDNARKAIQFNPQHIPSIQLLILSLSAMKLYDEAMILCKSALHEHHDNVSLLNIQCRLDMHTNNYRSALEIAKHILRCTKKPTINPKTLFAEDKDEELSAWLLVAEIFLKLGSIQDAELCVAEGSNNSGGALSYEMMLTRGLIAKEKNKLTEAKTFLQSSLALCPRHADVLRQIGHVHYLLGNYAIAEKYLKDSKDLDSDCYKTYQYLSLVYIQTSQHERAGKCARKATIIEESSPVVPISSISRLLLE